MSCIRTSLKHFLGAFLVAGIMGAARTAIAHGDLHERIGYLEAEIATNRSNPELWLRLADLQRQHGEFDLALASLDQATNLKPAWAVAHLECARIQFDSRKFYEAASAATDCLKLQPACADALVVRARSLVRLDEPGRAVEDYNALLNATNATPPLPDLYLERARALAGLKRWDEAIRGLDEGMQRIGATPSLAFPAIEYERQRGDFAAALARLERGKIFLNAGAYEKLKTEIQSQSTKP